MEHFAGLDVSVNETSVCIVDETGRIVREVKMAKIKPDRRKRELHRMVDDVPRGTTDEVRSYVVLPPIAGKVAQ